MIVTWFFAVCTFVVAGMWLLSRWIVRTLAAPEFFESYEAIGLVATGVILYALYLVLVVVLGRTGRTEFNFPATVVGTIVNIALNLALIPSSSGSSAPASPWSPPTPWCSRSCTSSPSASSRSPTNGGAWHRLLLTGAALLAAQASSCCRPRASSGLVSRLGVWLLYPAVLYATGFLSEEERRATANNLLPPRSGRRSATCARVRRRRSPRASPAAARASPARPSRRSSATRTPAIEVEKTTNSAIPIRLNGRGALKRSSHD